MTSSIHTLPSTFAARAAAAVLAFGLTIAFTPVARADAAADVPKLEVSYTDLDIATEQGARALYRRLATAARQVCPRGEGSLIPKLDDISRACIRDAISRAVHEVNSPQLAEVEATLGRRAKTG
jgi:UrcA family protein